MIVEGVGDTKVEAALIATRERLGVSTPFTRIDWNSVTWRVPDDAAVTATTTSDGPAPTLERVPMASAVEGERVAISVVVVFYNMRRESARTLHSLSRSYQRGIDGIDYEVIAVENGSDPDQRLTEEDVTALRSGVPLRRPGPEASASPTVALNRGIAMARGDHIAVMIDGAHVLTPGVLAHGADRDCRPTARRWSRSSSGTSDPASRATRCTRATTRRPRTG